MVRDFFRQFLLYSRPERRAVVTLLLLIVTVILVPKAFHYYTAIPKITLADSSLVREITLLNKADTIQEDEIDTSRSNLFQFDPNIIGVADWVKLGLSEKQAAVIEKYKSKGGRFRKPDDLRKIYVISDEMKDRLVPYVHIGRDESFYYIEINTADSAAFEELDGIGPTYASHIIKYRNALGGFYRVDQVGETHGISDSTFLLIKPHLTVNPALVTKMDINEADYETLRKHPYIHARIAHAIIGYRNMNGRYESLEELKKLKPITDELYNKIQHYLIVR